jgi:ethanolamine utilization protein EutN
MIIGEIIGDITSTIKHPKLESAKLLIVQPLDIDFKPKGETVVAVDSVDAGIGDRVLVVLEGKAASKAIGIELAPVEAACVGVIDEVQIDENY